MPLFEYECDKCMDGYNRDIDALVAKLNKTNATKKQKSWLNSAEFLLQEGKDEENFRSFFGELRNFVT